MKWQRLQEAAEGRIGVNGGREKRKGTKKMEEGVYNKPKGNFWRCETYEDNSVSIFVWMMSSYFNHPPISSSSPN